MSEDVNPKLGDLIKKAAHPSEGDFSGEEENSLVAPYAYVPGYTPGTNDRDLEVNLKAQADLSDASKKALSEYAHSYAKDRKNENYPPPAASDPAGHLRGDSLKKELVDASDANYYDKEFYSKESAYSGYFSSNEDINEKIVDKGLNVGTNSLSSLIKSVKGSTSSTFGVKSKADADITSRRPGDLDQGLDIQSVLDAFNKYTPGSKSPFVATDSGAGLGDGQLKKGLYSLYTGELGKFDKDKTAVTVKELRKAALEIIHRAQAISEGSSLSIAEGMLSNGSPFTGEGNISMLIPDATQVGYGTVEINSLRMRSALSIEKFGLAVGADDLLQVESFSTAFGYSSKEDPDLKVLAMNAKSYGTMNSPSEPFNGVAPFGMIMPVIYSIVALGLVGLLFGAIFAGIARAVADNRMNPENPSSMAFGLNAPRGSDFVGAEIAHKFFTLLGLPREAGIEFTSMVRGIMLFYGIDINPFQPGAAIADAFINLLYGPGYYLVVSKKVTADTEQITKAFGNFTKVSGGFDAITITLSSIEALFSSFTMRFFLTMNNIGLIDEQGRTQRGVKAHGQSVMSLRDEQSAKMPLYPSTRNQMSRFYPKSGRRPYSPLSAMLFNAQFLSTPDTNGVNSLEIPESDTRATIETDSIGSYRLTTEQVRQIEDKIDGEYMPFSIHDLRTNEVISLPAFIESINDDFSAEYNSTHGFGRTDPVHIYTKTTRNVGLTFSLIAMSPKDHNYIWYLVNKFVSMVYPQRDEGRKRTLGSGNDKKEFVQPFSQRIVASPVVRIRVGDTIASNASDSAFAKIFGGTDEIAIKESDPKKRAAAKEAIDSLGKLYGYYKKLKMSEFAKAFTTNEGSTSGQIIIKKGCTIFLKKDDKYVPFKSQYDIKVDKITYAGKHDPMMGDSKHYWRATYNEVNDEIDAYALGGVPLLSAMRKIKGALPIPPPPIGTADDLTLLVSSDSVDHVQPVFEKSAALKELKDNKVTADALAKAVYPNPGHKTEEEAKKALSDKLKKLIESLSEYPSDGDINSTMTEFLNPKKNPFTRAFESTEGRGLAGVITQLGLGYSDSIWGTTFDEGGLEDALRAPKKVTITLAFSPIHDMPLGLNYKGEMFAPSHPVGILSKQKLDERSVDEKIKNIKERARLTVGFLPDTDNPAEIKLPF